MASQAATLLPSCWRGTAVCNTVFRTRRLPVLRGVQNPRNQRITASLGEEPYIANPACKGNIGCFLDMKDGTSSDGHREMEDGTGTGAGAAASSPPRHRQWQDLTTKEFEALDSKTAIAILPVAAIEQHGPHLPVSTDATINEGILKHVLGLLPPGLQVLVLPAMPVGKSNEHIAYPGTLSLSANTLMSLWIDIGESVARSGVRKMVIFNSHGGQPQVMDVVARELRARCSMLVVTLNWFSFGVPDSLFPEHELRHGIHGGSVETSLMLYLRPDLVQMDKAELFESLSVRMEEDGYRILAPEGRVGFGWQMQDLHEAGVCGDAKDADVERGRRVVVFAAEKLVELLVEVHRFPLEWLRDRQSSSLQLLHERAREGSKGEQNGAIDISREEDALRL